MHRADFATGNFNVVLASVIAVLLLGLGSLRCEAAGLSLIDFNSVSAFGSAGAGRGVNGGDASVISTNPAGMALLHQEQAVVSGSGVFPGGTARGQYQTPASNPPNPEHLYTPEQVDYYQFHGGNGDYHRCTGFDAGKGICYAQSSKVDDFLHPAIVPSLYYARPIDDDIWIGLAVYAPYGGESRYPIESVFRYQALSSKMQLLVAQPTLSWRYREDLALGVGVQIARGKLEMGRTLNPWATALNDAFADIQGNGLGLGATFGVIWEPADALTLGLSYRSPVKITFKGDLTGTGVPGLGIVMAHYSDENDEYFGGPIPAARESARWLMMYRPPTVKEDIRSEVTFPESVDLSAAWKLNSEWTLLGSAIWTRWSRFKHFKISSHGSLPGRSASDIVSTSNGVPSGHLLAYLPQNWSDTWSLSCGAQYQLSDNLVLRAGYSHDNSPVSDATRSARIPDNDRQWLTMGVGYKLSDNYTLDLAYGYMFMPSFSIQEANYKADGSRQGLTPDGTFEDPGHLTARYTRMHAHTLSAQLTVRF